MYKRYAIFLSILISHLISAQSSEMLIEPQKPKYNDTLTYLYQPDVRYQQLASAAKQMGYGPYLVVRAYDGKPGQPKSYSVPMDSVDENTYSANFVAATGEAYLDAKVVFPFEPEYRDDKNNGRFWNKIIYQKDGLPVRNANYYKGLAMASGDDGRLTDLREAMDAYKAEQKQYADNYLNSIALKSLMLDMRKLSYDKFVEEMEELLLKTKPDYSQENTVRAISRLYKMMGKNNEATKIEKSFVLSNTKSDLAQEFLLEQLATAASKKEFIDISEQFLKSFGDSQKALAVYSALSSVYVVKGDYSLLIDKLSSYKHLPSQIWVETANSMITDKNFMPNDSMSKRIDSASAIMRRGAGVRVEDQITQIFLQKPRDISAAEAMRDDDQQYASLLVSIGDFFYTIGKDSLAYLQYREAYEILGEHRIPEPLYQQLVLTAKNSLDTTLADKFAEEAISMGTYTRKILDYYIERYVSQNPDKADFAERELDKLKSKGMLALTEQMPYYDISSEQPSAIFSTPDALYIDTEDWEDKIVTLSFISSWCTPCSDILTTLNALDSKYASNDTLLFYAVSVWEKAEDKTAAASTIENQTPLSFPLLLDKTDIIPQKFNVTGLPTTLILDMQGNIRFKFDGLETIEGSYNKISAALEMLKAESNK